MPLFWNCIFFLFTFVPFYLKGQSLPKSLNSKTVFSGLKIGNPMPVLDAAVSIDSIKNSRSFLAIAAYYKIHFVIPVKQNDEANNILYLLISLDSSKNISAVHFIVKDSPELLDKLKFHYGQYDSKSSAQSLSGGNLDQSYYWYKTICLYYLTTDISSGTLTGRFAILTFSNCKIDDVIRYKV